MASLLMHATRRAHSAFQLVPQRRYAPAFTASLITNRSFASSAIRSNPLNVMFFGVDEFDAVYLKALIEEKYKSNPAIGHINVVTISDRTQKNLYDHPVLYEAPVKILAVSGVISTRRISAMQDMHKLEFKFKEDHGFDMKFDIGIIGNFPYHISPFVKDQFRLGCYSIHNSLLPKYRGPTPVETAILNKDKATGVTISEYSPNNPDTGKILIQTPINLPELPRRTSVLYSLSNAGSFLLVDSLKNIELLREKAVTQNEQEATYTKEYQDSFCKIVWEKSTAEEIERKSRAFEGKFFVHTNWVGKKLRRRISLESVELPRKDQKPLDKKIELGRPGSLYYDNVSNYLETVCIDRTRLIIKKLRIYLREASAGKKFKSNFLRTSGGSRLYTDPVHEDEIPPPFVYPPGTDPAPPKPKESPESSD